MKIKEVKVLNNSNYYLHTPTSTAEKLYFYPMALGAFEFDKDFNSTRSKFDCFNIVYIKEGSVTIKTSNKTFFAKKGQFVILDCYSPITYIGKEKWSCLWMYFNGSNSQEFYNQIVEKNSNVIDLKNPLSLYKTLNELYIIFHTAQTIDEFTISQNIVSLLNGLLVDETSSSGSTDSKLIDCIKYMNDNYSNQIKLDELADQCDLSVYYFSRVFTKKTGLSPYQYLLNIRLLNAKFYLKYTEASIKEIAKETGFNNDTAFFIAFKKAVGMSPSEYRNQDNN